MKVISSDQRLCVSLPVLYSLAESIRAVHHQWKLGNWSAWKIWRWWDNVHLQTPKWNLQHCRRVLFSGWSNKWSPWCLCKFLVGWSFWWEKNIVWCLHATLTAFNSNTSYCFVFYSCNRILGILLSLTLNPSLLQITGNLNSTEDFFSLILLIQ